MKYNIVEPYAKERKVRVDMYATAFRIRKLSLGDKVFFLSSGSFSPCLPKLDAVAKRTV